MCHSWYHLVLICLHYVLIGSYRLSFTFTFSFLYLENAILWYPHLVDYFQNDHFTFIFYCLIFKKKPLLKYRLCFNHKANIKHVVGNLNVCLILFSNIFHALTKSYCNTEHTNVYTCTILFTDSKVKISSFGR